MKTMKLEPKHVTPYFEHDIRIMVGELQTGIFGLNHSELRVGLQRFPYIQNVLYNEIKLILHPISYFKGSRTGGEVLDELDCTLSTVHKIWDFADGDMKLKDVSYGTILVMCKNHIDFMGLIDKGEYNYHTGDRKVFKLN